MSIRSYSVLPVLNYTALVVLGTFHCRPKNKRHIMVYAVSMAVRAATGDTDPNATFLEYHEPNIIQLLILISFFFFLSLGEWLSDKVFRAGLIGQIIVGLIYGLPIGNIMLRDWQETFVALGYVGLVLIIFEGGLAVRLDLLQKYILPGTVAATIGVLLPIAFCYLLLFLGFGFGAVETFIIGAALSTTSLGTTFVVIRSAARGLNFSDTKIGTILITAAVLDDVTGLIMASVISQLGGVGNGNVNIGWLVGRPTLASVAISVLTPLFSKYVASPVFRWYIEDRFMRYKHVSNIILMVLTLSAFISIAAFAGASVLFGAFVAGAFLNSLPCIHPSAPFVVADSQQGETDPEKTPSFLHTFERYFHGALTYILQPMFFASIGFAIPFQQLWAGIVLWRGVVLAILMVIGKMAVGAIVPLWDAISKPDRGAQAHLPGPWGVTPARTVAARWKPALMLGMAMVARGEIGLLIIQIGLNSTPFLSEHAFLVAAWAIVLNTIIGPLAVGMLLKRFGEQICEHPTWGVQTARDQGDFGSGGDGSSVEEGLSRKTWSSRRHSKAVNRSRSRSRHVSRPTSVVNSVETTE